MCGSCKCWDLNFVKPEAISKARQFIIESNNFTCRISLQELDLADIALISSHISIENIFEKYTHIPATTTTTATVTLVVACTSCLCKNKAAVVKSTRRRRRTLFINRWVNLQDYFCVRFIHTHHSDWTANPLQSTYVSRSLSRSLVRFLSFSLTHFFFFIRFALHIDNHNSCARMKIMYVCELVYIKDTSFVLKWWHLSIT